VAKLYPDLTTLVAAVDVARLVEETIHLLHAIIGSVETANNGKKAVIVACAGNDSARPNKEADTGSPAALSAVFPDHVAAVGALKTEGADMKVASYSNKLPAGGLLAFGGEYAKNAEDEGDGIVSIYSKGTISGKPNTHGLAEWAGTSFAAPIVVSEIALQCRDTGKDPVEALQAVRTAAAGRVPAGYVDVLVSPA
jgi:subtilisin family serine protease